MKILIIGGTGLISVSITKYLLDMENSDLDTYEDRLIESWQARAAAAQPA